MTEATRHAVLEPLEATKGFAPIYLVGFVVVLAIALTGKLLAWDWRTWFPGAEGESALIPSVRSAVYTFMSHLS
ncbi:MAG: hypothetical protein FJY39_11545 [Betaproteobacteria bacterium]|nr:hypothetical protein [Betaproteobacteria bacterium]